MLAAVFVQLFVEDLQQSIEVPINLWQFRLLDDPAHEPLEHGVEQAAGIEGGQPPVGVVVERIGWLDTEPIPEKESPRTSPEHLEAVCRSRSPMILSRIEQWPSRGHMAVVRSECG